MNRIDIPATVSTALHQIWTGPLRDATVVAVFERAAYLDVSDRTPCLVAVVTRDGVHQPGSIVLGAESTQQPLRQVSVGQAAQIGASALVLGRVHVRLTRWWNPRPHLAARAPRQLLEFAETIEQAIARLQASQREHHSGLVDAADRVAASLAVGAIDEACHQARRLIGAGPGLTPAGDDILAGLIAGLQLLTVRSARTAKYGDSEPGADTSLAAAAATVGQRIAGAATDRTTFVSAALLAHAARGEVAREVAIMLTDPTPTAVANVMRIGATSGPDLCLGIVLAARTIATACTADAGSDDRLALLAERSRR
ncbi:MAG: DUF2877 domain-containing protein [Nitriliruptoraceae bacterium]